MYNGIGNVLSVKTTTASGSSTTKSFTYNGDRLTSYGGTSISYNAMGCPTLYGSKHLDWANGRLTKYYDEPDPTGAFSSESVRFEYNAYGQRTLKEYVYDPGSDYSGDFLIGTTSEYTYDHSGRLVRELITDYFTESASVEKELVFLYDESGMIGVMYSYNGSTPTPYYYQRNLQGDVVAIYDTNGNKKASYSYDAFGNCTTAYAALYDIAYNNPIRYRGYYYDRETNFYYLNARYYNPEWRRFISPANVNAFNPQTVNGLNLYLYAGNNPINVQYNGSLLSTTSNAIGTIGFTSSIGPLGVSSSLSSFGWVGSMISGLSSAHGVVDKASSYLVGSLDGVLNYAGISKFNGFQSKLAKYSKWLLGIGIGLDIAASAYGNYHNSKLTLEQKWASFGADIGYIGVTSALSYGAGALVTKDSVALGSAAAGYAVGATIGGVTIGYVGAIAIGATVVVVGVVAGTILITVVSDALDNWWDEKKEEWFS